MHFLLPKIPIALFGLILDNSTLVKQKNIPALID